MICDFSTDEMHVNLSGDASGNRFSSFYMAGMEDWAKGIYMVIKP